jgi:hypothetical protein
MVRAQTDSGEQLRKQKTGSFRAQKIGRSSSQRSGVEEERAPNSIKIGTGFRSRERGQRAQRGRPDSP